MLYVNDKPVDFKKKTGLNYVEKLIKQAWEELVDTYDLDKGGTIHLKYLKDVGKKTKVLTSKGSKKGVSIKYPQSIGVSRVSTIVSEDFDEYEIVLADKRVMKNIGGETQYSYLPASSIKFTRQMKLGIGQRDLILYLYLFSTVCESAPKWKKFNIPKIRRPYFVFADKKLEAQSEFDRIKAEYRIINTIEEMDDKQAYMFARRISLRDIKTSSRILLNKSISDAVKSNATIRKQLFTFVEEYSKEYFSTIDIVNEAIEKGVVSVKKVTEKKAILAKYYILGREKSVFATLYKLESENLEAFASFISKKDNLLDAIKTKLNEVNKGLKE